RKGRGGRDHQGTSRREDAGVGSFGDRAVTLRARRNHRGAEGEGRDELGEELPAAVVHPGGRAEELEDESEAEEGGTPGRQTEDPGFDPEIRHPLNGQGGDGAEGETGAGAGA